MKRILLYLGFLLLFFAPTALLFFDPSFPFGAQKEPIRVGLVFSLTGPRSFKEIPTKKATLMAIDEINRKGGLLGRPILPIIRDGQSKMEIIRQEAEDLIVNEHVQVVFGCGVPNIRPVIKDLFEKYNSLLINPFQYDGLTHSENVIFMGATLNQQVVPTVDYCFKTYGKRLFFVGSDFINPHIVGLMIRDQVVARQGEMVGEIYIPLESGNVDEVVAQIVQKQPNAILINILGSDNYLFFKKLREAGIDPTEMPIFSFNITEANLATTENISDLVGNFATWNYFQSINTQQNQQFVSDYKHFSDYTFTDNPIEAGYLSVHLWAKAVTEAGNANYESLNFVFDNMRMLAPEGFITMDFEGNSAWKFSRIGKILPDRQFQIVWQSDHPIRPIPYQLYRSQAEWQAIIDEIFLKYGDGSDVWY